MLFYAHLNIYAGILGRSYPEEDGVPEVRPAARLSAEALRARALRGVVAAPRKRNLIICIY